MAELEAPRKAGDDKIPGNEAKPPLDAGAMHAEVYGSKGPESGQETSSSGELTCQDVVGGLRSEDSKPIVEYDYKDGIASWGISPGRDFRHTVKLGLYGNRTEEDRLSTAEQSDFKAEPSYKGLAREVFGNSSFEIVRNHNQVLDVNEAAVMKKHGISKDDPVVLINFDSHSDMYLQDMARDGNESIANWVNTTLARNPNITDFYWVLPNEFKNNPALHDHFFMDAGKAKEHDHGSRRNMALVEPELKVYFNNSTGKMHLYKLPEGASAEDFREVKIHKVALDDMPSMKGKNVILSTDLDGFANKGHDTEQNAQVPFKSDSGFEHYLRQLKEKGVKPFLHTVSVSPEYLQDQHVDQALNFGALVGEVSRDGMDMNATNARNLIAPDKVPGFAGTQAIQTGVTLERQSNKDLQALYKMFENDRKTHRPDGAINLANIDSDDGSTGDSKMNDELKASISMTMEVYGIDREAAKNLLKRWDAKDGKQDGILQFQSIEELLVNTCHK